MGKKMNHATTKKEAFAELLEQFSDVLSNNGCNDFYVANTPEMFLALEEAGARNLNMTLEEFRKCSDYEDYAPRPSKDGTTLFTTDYTILAMIEKELGLE